MELSILLPQPPGFKDYRRMPPYLAISGLLKELPLTSLLTKASTWMEVLVGGQEQ